MAIVAKGFLVLIACIIRSGNFRFVVDAFNVPTKQHMVVRDSTYTCRSCPLLPATTSTTTSTALPAWGLGKTMVVGGAAVCVRKAARVIKQGDVSIVERLGYVLQLMFVSSVEHETHYTHITVSLLHYQRCVFLANSIHGWNQDSTS